MTTRASSEQTSLDYMRRDKYPLFTPEEEYEAASRLNEQRIAIDLQIYTTQFPVNSETARKNGHNKIIRNYDGLGYDTQNGNNHGRVSISVEEGLRSVVACRDDEERLKLREQLPPLIRIELRNEFASALRQYAKEGGKLEGLLGITLEDPSEYVTRFDNLYGTYRKMTDDFIYHNLRLVISRTSNYSENIRSDLIQQGSIGLMIALEKFDPTRAKFSTYALYWINRMIISHNQKTSTMIRMPAHMGREFYRFVRTANNLGIDLSKFNADDLMKIKEEMDLSDGEVGELFEIYRVAHTISLDTPVNELDGKSATLGDFITGDSSLEEETERRDAGERLHEAMNMLPERERRILELRYGIGDDSPRSLKKVGRIFGVTRERIRQIEFRALTELRQHEKVKNIRDGL